MASVHERDMKCSERKPARAGPKGAMADAHHRIPLATPRTNNKVPSRPAPRSVAGSTYAYRSRKHSFANNVRRGAGDQRAAIPYEQKRAQAHPARHSPPRTGTPRCITSSQNDWTDRAGCWAEGGCGEIEFDCRATIWMRTAAAIR